MIVIVTVESLNKVAQQTSLHFQGKHSHMGLSDCSFKQAANLQICTLLKDHLLSHFAFGSMFSPEVPREVMIIVNWVFGAMVIGFAFQLVVDAASLILSALSMRQPTSRGQGKRSTRQGWMLSRAGMCKRTRQPRASKKGQGQP